MYFLFILFYISFISQTLTSVPEITLNNGHKMPILGTGTCCQLGGRMVFKMLTEAIDVGYRHIDTAYIYGDELDVGLAVESKIKEKKIKREDMFITTKLWNTYHSYTRVAEGVELALKQLNVKYIDLMLIHWPMGYAEGVEDVPKKTGSNEIIGSKVDYLETWKALEQSVSEGLIKSIGISNFNSEQIERLLLNAKIKPAVLQIESHPHLTQKPLIQLCAKHGIAVTAYSPLGTGKLIDDKTLVNIGKKHNKSAAQVMIRYQIQRGVSVIPRSLQKQRIEENFNVFHFKLTTEDMNTIDKMNSDMRYNTEDGAKTHIYYPFNIPY